MKAASVPASLSRARSYQGSAARFCPRNHSTVPMPQSTSASSAASPSSRASVQGLLEQAAGFLRPPQDGVRKGGVVQGLGQKAAVP